MTALAITFAVIILIALLRFGVSVEYSGEGFYVVANAGPLSLQVYPRREKPGLTRKMVARKVRRDLKKAEKKAKKKPEEKKPGRLKDYLETVPAIWADLGRLRRRLLIKRLTVRYTAAGPDPAATAQLYGAATAVFAVVLPAIDRLFRVRRRDLQTAVDFQADEQLLFVSADVSLAVWEALYIIFALVPALVKLVLKTQIPVVKKGKDLDKDG